MSLGAAAPTLPEGDDVLAKWMTLRADEDRLLSYANVCNAGCQMPAEPDRARPRPARALARPAPARRGQAAQAPA